MNLNQIESQVFEYLDRNVSTTCGALDTLEMNIVPSLWASRVHDMAKKHTETIS
jgi:hypothetical protein